MLATAACAFLSAAPAGATIYIQLANADMNGGALTTVATGATSASFSGVYGDYSVQNITASGYIPDRLWHEYVRCLRNTNSEFAFYHGDGNSDHKRARRIPEYVDREQLVIGLDCRGNDVGEQHRAIRGYFLGCWVNTTVECGLGDLAFFSVRGVHDQSKRRSWAGPVDGEHHRGSGTLRVGDALPGLRGFGDASIDQPPAKGGALRHLSGAIE